MAESHTNAEVQQALKSLGFDPGDIDGAIGIKTSGALSKFQETKGLVVNGTPDSPTLKALFPGPTGPRTIQATAWDWVLNFATSRVVWAAGAIVAAVAVWVNTKLGLNIPADLQNTITQLLVYGGMALIGLLRTFADSPHVANKQPAVIQKPAEMK